MSTTETQVSSPTDAAPAELMTSVDDLLNQLTDKFSTVSSGLMTKMDEMSRRLDKLESAIQQSTAQLEDNTTKSKG